MKAVILIALMMLFGAGGVAAQGRSSEKMQSPAAAQGEVGGGRPASNEPRPQLEQKREIRGAEERANRSSERGEQRATKSGARKERAQKDGRSGEKASDKAERSAEKEERTDRRRARDETMRKEPARDTEKDVESAGAKTLKGEKESAKRSDRDRDARESQSRAKGKEGDTPSKEARESDRKPDAGERVQLSSAKRDRVTSAFRRESDVKHITDVDIDISVGRPLPRDWDFAPLPIAVVEIVPEYRGYVYVYVDDEYVICDPESYEVVAVIPVEAAYAEGGAAEHRCTVDLSLDDDERELIARSLRRDDEVDVSDLTVGWSVPRDIELKEFPDDVLARTSELDPCRYFVAEDQIAIVDPDEDKVVLLIDKS